MPESEELKNQQETNAARVPVAAGAVFVSHASEDAAIAKSLVAALEQQGLTCWIAPRDVAPGSLYADQIIGAINKAKVVALILSKDALASPHVSREIERASSKRRPIITLRADPSELTPAFEYFLSESQWIDVAAEGRHKAFGKAVTAIRQHVEGAAGAETFRAAAGPLQQPSAINRLRWLLLIATVLLVGFALAWMAINKSRAVKFQAPLKLSVAQERRIANSAGTAPFTPPARSIAVLPFINMSGDPKQDYFSDGISEELLNSLSRLDGLLVVARTSSFRFKGTDTDVSTIARKLNVGTVLEGSVRRAGNTVRITVQLINAVSGFHLWSEEYDRKLTDILKIQSEVARAVARQLSGQLTAEDVKKLEQGGTANQPAYEANLRGVRITRGADNEKAFRAALAEFDRAIALDPDYAEAYVGRAFELLDIANFTEVEASRPILRKGALMAARRAVELSPNYGRAHLILAVYFETVAADFTGAETEYEKALALAPGVAGVHTNLSTLYLKIGRQSQAEAEARKAVSLDPQNYLSHVGLAIALYFARNYPGALNALHDAEAVKPESHDINRWIVNVMLSSAEAEQLRQYCESSATPLDEDMRHYCLAITYHRLGRQADAEREFAALRKMAEDYWSFQYADVFAQWGDKAEALQWLNKADTLGGESIQYIRVDPLLDPIRDDPQYKAIEARQRFPP